MNFDIHREEHLQKAAYALLIFFAIGFSIACWALYTAYVKAPEPQTSSISTTLEDRCKFKMKTSATPFTITENSAGTYNYELYMTSDGYIEVWECPPNVIK